MSNNQRPASETVAATLPATSAPAPTGPRPARTLIGTGVALVGALVFTGIILSLAKANPLDVFLLLLSPFSDALAQPANYRKLADTVMLAAPLLLCAAGLTLTFSAGLYNLGIEGQLALGAVFALLIMRLLPGLPPPLLWTLAFLMGALGGALWAWVAGLLKLYGRVSEIFAGLGLNFLATGVTLYLVAGPWKKPGSASVTSTELLPNTVWLPTVTGLRLAPIAPVVALVAIAVVWFALTRTRWGLDVRATGLNMAASERLGVPAVRRLMEALGACGALAGMAGAIQVLAVHHALIPNISSGIGLLALLVVLLVRFSPSWVLPVVVAFACFSVGSLPLPLSLNVDSSIGGVLQGALVLFALLGRGIAARR